MTKKSAYFVLSVTAVFVVGFGYLAHAQMVGVTLPSIPTGVSATVASQPLQVSISWSASAESSGTIAGYYIYRNGVEITATAGTSFVNSGLTPGVYSYTVAAYDTTGNTSAQSSPSSVTLISDTTPPSVPAGVTISGTTVTSSSYGSVTLTITWSPSTDNVGVAGYYVYRNGVSITTSTSAAFTGTSITDTVAPGTYNYAVVAYDAAQNFSARSTPATVTVSVDTVSPSVPTSVFAQQVSANGVNISWGASTDSAGLSGYQIFRNGVQVATTTGSPYADGGLSVGSTYYYQVAAYDVAGNASNPSSPAVSVTIQPTSGPGTPYGLVATLSGTSTVALSWAPSIDPLAITSYTLYRNGAQIAAVTSTRYLDEGLVASGTYYVYNVTATDVSGAVSSMSASSSVIVPSAAVVPVSALTPAPVVTSPVPVTGSAIPTGVTVVAGSSTAPTSLPALAGSFTQSLYFGLRSAQVSMLQSLLAQNGYLTSVNTTGFFGSLTRSALEKFQCDKGIACTGDAGWGLVGPKTRNILNALSSGGAASVTVVSSSPSALSAELQALEAELASLQQQAQNQK